MVVARAFASSSTSGAGSAAFENQAVRKHEADQLAKLAAKLGHKLPTPGSSSGASAAESIGTVTVVGAGLMGAGIAQVAAQHGLAVRLVDRSEAVLTASKSRIADSVARIAKKTNAASDWAANVNRSVTATTDLEKACAGTDLVIEAVLENLQAKWEVFSQIEKFSPAHTIFASNTSSLRIGEIASGMGDGSRLGGLHFFNPVPVMQLVEVVRAAKTSDETVDFLAAFGARLGKQVIHARDTPGFIVNRLLVPFMAEAMRMLERGDASAQDIDLGMKLGAAHPMGPLTLADYVGLDTCKFIMDGWHEAHPEETLFRTPNILTQLVGRGQLGNKTGAGFYKDGAVNPLVKTLLSGNK